MGKSITSVQDSTLAQFRNAAMGNSQDKIQEYIELSRQKRKAFEEKMANREKPFLQKGFTNSQIDQIEAKIAKDKEQEVARLQESIENRNRHSMLNGAIDMFGIHETYNASTLAGLNKKEFQLHDTKTIKVVSTIGRCLSSSIKISVTVSVLTPYYRKSDNFDQDKQSVLDYRWIDTKHNFTGKYGSLIRFRKTLLPNFSNIIEVYNISDQNINDDVTENIWEFKF